MPSDTSPTLSASKSELPRGLVRAIASTALGIGVAALAAYLLGVKPEEVVANVRGVSPWAVSMCVLSGFIVLGFQSLRWYMVMSPLLGLRYSQAYRAQIVGMMFNAILPARGGDLLRVQYLGRRTGKSRATILGTEIVDRWLDWWGWMPVFVILALTSDPPSWMYQALALFGGALGAWGGVMVVLARRGYRPKKGTKLGEIYAAFATGIEAFRSKRTWFIAFFVAPLPWLWEAFILTQAAHAFGIELSLMMAFSVMIGFNLATIVPSPGALGTVEAGGTAALAFFGVDHSKALAFIFVYHFAQLLPGIAGGVSVLAAEGERLFGKNRTLALPADDGEGAQA
jgi:glycosyltransferase 2 family protein